MKSFPQTACYKPTTQHECTLQQTSSFREVSHEPNTCKTNYGSINLEITPFLYGRNLASVTTHNSFNNMLNTSLYTPDDD